MNDEIIYFSVNDWDNIGMPRDDWFSKWAGRNEMTGQLENLMSHEFCLKEKLVVTAEIMDQSITFCVSAPKSYIEKNIPKIIGSAWQDFPNEGEVFPRYGIYDGAYLEYKEKNFGVTWQKL